VRERGREGLMERERHRPMGSKREEERVRGERERGGWPESSLGIE